MKENPGKLYFMTKILLLSLKTDFFFECLKGPVFFCNFYIRVDREALVSERALDVGSVAFKAMSTKILLQPTGHTKFFMKIKISTFSKSLT
jgi:uncharacterized membrane protein